MVEVLEKLLLNFSGGEHVKVFAASRTDSGVHALGQAIHFDLIRKKKGIIREPYTQETLLRGLNAHLEKSGEDIVFRSLETAPDSFRVQSNTGKTYFYRLAFPQSTGVQETKSKNLRPIFDTDFLWWIPENIDLNKIEQLSKAFIGTHDITIFQTPSHETQTPIRTITDISISEETPPLLSPGIRIVQLQVTGKSFVYHQVRNLVGALVQVGTNTIQGDFVLSAFHKKKRPHQLLTAPPQGLFLKQVYYD